MKELIESIIETIIAKGDINDFGIKLMTKSNDHIVLSDYDGVPDQQQFMDLVLKSSTLIIISVVDYRVNSI